MKRRGPYSMANAGRKLVKPEAPPPDALRDKIAEEVHEVIDRYVQDEKVQGDGVGETILWGVLAAAAEYHACVPAEIRSGARERAIRFFRDQSLLEVKRYHEKTVNRISHSEVTVNREGGLIAEADTTAMTDRAILLALKPVFARYIDELSAFVGKMIKPEDPRGASIMAVYALNETLADLVAEAPLPAGEKLFTDMVEMFQTRVTTKRERKRESSTTDGQLQADPLEAVPTVDDERLQLLRSEGREEPGDGVLRPAAPAEGVSDGSGHSS